MKYLTNILTSIAGLFGVYASFIYLKSEGWQTFGIGLIVSVLLITLKSGLGPLLKDQINKKIK